MDSLTDSDLRTVGEFRLLARLGAGGMGQVFLASSLAGRMVAVKVIHPDLCRDAEFVRRFRNEAEAAQKVSGWYTAPVVAVGVTDNPPWLATAFVAGPPLEDVIARYGPLPPGAVWRLAAGLAEALRAIHAAGLVHRDLKPANVLLALDGPRVIDFGIARAVSDTRLTATGSVIGTPSYMSPEQVEALETGAASDVFSFGSVLAFAASGTAPFSGRGGSSASVMYRIVHTEPDLSPVPADIRGLVEACLAKDPRQRPDLGRVAAYAAAAAERLGLSPASFWPPEVAAVIQAQEAALTAQIEAVGVAPAPLPSGLWPPGGPGTAPSGRLRTGPTAPPGYGAPPGYPAPPGYTARPGLEVLPPGLEVLPPGPEVVPGGARPPSRRGLLIGAATGAVAVLGGTVGWALSSRSLSSSGQPPAGATGSALPGSTSLPASQYYGAGARATAAWRVRTGNAVDANPGTGGGLVCVGSTDNNVYAVDSATGRTAWSFPAGAVYSAPQVAGGVVCLATTAGHFYALHAASGRPAWSLDTGAPAVYKRTWAVDGGNVILTSDTSVPRAYGLTTGTAGVSYPTQEPYAQALAASGGVLYALDALGVLYAFQAASGAGIWRRQLLSDDDPPGTDLTVGDGRLYLGTISGTLYAVDTATGRPAWTYHPGSGIESELALDAGVVYLKDNNGTLHAVSAASGKPQWTRSGTATGLYGVAAAGGRVYYSTALALQAVDAASGTPAWAFGAPGPAEFLSTPAVAGGLVFIGCHDDSLYAVKA